MGKVLNIEELKIWRKARQIVEEVYQGPVLNKDFGFNDQTQRVAVSIMNNIAEDHEYGSRDMFRNYLKISLGSCGKIRNMLSSPISLKSLIPLTKKT